MAFSFADSFETITAGGDLTLRGWTLSGTPTVETTIFKDGTQCISLDLDEFARHDTGAAANKIVFASFWFYKDHEDTAKFFIFRGSGTAELYLEAQANNTVIIKDQAATALGTSSAVLLSDTWHHIEFKGVFKNSIAADDVTLTINGVLQVTVATATDTQLAAEDTITRIELDADNEAAKNNYFDSIVVWDEDAGDDWSASRGRLRIEVVEPDGTGNSADFTGSDADSTDNYLHVDEVNAFHDVDASYTESSTATDKDLYTYADMAATGVIVGVQGVLIAKKVLAAARGLKQVTRVGTTDYLGAENLLTEDVYVAYTEIWDEDPDATAPWTKTSVNAAEFGVEVST